MKIVVLIFGFFLSCLAFAMDRKYDKDDDIVTLNIGGHKLETTPKIIKNSDSAVLKAAICKKFARKTDAAGHPFFDCSEKFAEVIHGWICHGKIYDCNLDLVKDVAEYFACDDLKKALVRLKVPKEERYVHL